MLKPQKKVCCHVGALGLSFLSVSPQKQLSIINCDVTFGTLLALDKNWIFTDAFTSNALLTLLHWERKCLLSYQELSLSEWCTLLHRKTKYRHSYGEVISSGRHWSSPAWNLITNTSYFIFTVFTWMLKVRYIVNYKWSYYVYIILPISVI